MHRAVSSIVTGGTNGAYACCGERQSLSSSSFPRSPVFACIILLEDAFSLSIYIKVKPIAKPAAQIELRNAKVLEVLSVNCSRINSHLAKGLRFCCSDRHAWLLIKKQNRYREIREIGVCRFVQLFLTSLMVPRSSFWVSKPSHGLHTLECFQFHWGFENGFLFCIFTFHFGRLPKMPVSFSDDHHFLYPLARISTFDQFRRARESLRNA